MSATSKNLPEVAQVDLKRLKPYGDIMDDGVVQLAFTLPVEVSPEAREAAVQLVQKMGYDQIKVATMEKAANGFALFVIYGRLRHTIDFTAIKVLKVEAPKRSREEIDEIIEKRIGRKLVILGACTGYDAHTVGIDAIINMKGFAGDYGLERYQWLDARNLGAQVQNDELLKLAVEHGADAILVSKVVSQHNIHIRDMKDLMAMAAKRGLKDKLIFVAGGPRVTHPMALECGFDAGFGVGTKPSDVASYVVEEYLRREAAAKGGSKVKHATPRQADPATREHDAKAAAVKAEAKLVSKARAGLKGKVTAKPKTSGKPRVALKPATKAGKSARAKGGR